eukprot:3510506-Rhodomonas_salina.1
MALRVVFSRSPLSLRSLMIFWSLSQISFACSKCLPRCAKRQLQVARREQRAVRGSLVRLREQLRQPLDLILVALPQQAVRPCP